MAARKQAMKKTASRKRATRKQPVQQATRSQATRRGRAFARLERDLPASLRQYAKQVAGRLNSLERQIGRTRQTARRGATRLLREASRELGKLEAKGEAGWRKLTTSTRRQAVRLLHRLEDAVAPKARRAPARKQTARKPTRR